MKPDDPRRGNSWFTQVCGHLASLFQDASKAYAFYLDTALAIDSWSLKPQEQDRAKRTANSVWNEEAGKRAADDSAWETPESLDVTLPDFPLTVLPKLLQDLARGVSEATQTPPDLTVFTAFGVMSGATRGAFQVKVTQDWYEQLALFLIAASNSGERKTSVFDIVKKPLFELEREKRKAQNETFEFDMRKHEALKKAAKKAEDQYASEPDADGADDGKPSAGSRGVADSGLSWRCVTVERVGGWLIGLGG